jgi:hypothetical protein
MLFFLAVTNIMAAQTEGSTQSNIGYNPEPVPFI